MEIFGTKDKPGGIVALTQSALDVHPTWRLLVSPSKGTFVRMAGNEGVYGVPLALGVTLSPVRALVQGAGTAWRMSADISQGGTAGGWRSRRSVVRSPVHCPERVTRSTSRR